MELKEINQQLKDQFGSTWTSQQNYRVVWSDDLTEKRLGEFTDYMPGTNIILRRVKEVREVKKYQIEPQYVLEKLIPNIVNPEIDDKLSYEPFWCFGFEKISDGSKKAKEPIYRACYLLITLNTNPKILTPSQMDDKEWQRSVEDERIMLELMNENIKSDSMHVGKLGGEVVYLNSPTTKEGG